MRSSTPNEVQGQIKREPKSKRERNNMFGYSNMAAVKGTTNWRNRHVSCGQREPSK